MDIVIHKKDDQLKIRKICIILILLPLLFAFLTGFGSALSDGTETSVTTAPTCSYQSRPAIYGDKIVWEDVRDPTISQIYLYDLTTGKEYPLNTSPRFQYHPAIFEHTVVWAEPDLSGNTAKIIRYDTAALTRNEYEGHYDSWNYEYNFPKISGSILVWQDYNTTNSNWDIVVVRNTSSLPEIIIYGDGDQKHPEIYQQTIVYENWTGGSYASPSHIWLYNLSNNTAVPLSEAFYQETLPHIYGDRVVWEATNLSGDGTHIHLYEHGVTTRITPVDALFDQVHPAIFGSRVVVEDGRRGASHNVYLYDLLSGTETWVAPNTLSASQMNPDIYDTRIIWMGTRAGFSDSDIYLLTLGGSFACPAADFSAFPSSGLPGLFVTFTDRSQGSPILFTTWNFSDGSFLSHNPVLPVTHQFTSAGIYPVKLITGNTRCRNITPDICKYKVYIDAPPDPDFSGTPASGFTPLTVHFTDTSCGEPETWIWNFGDGNASTEKNPTHVYTMPGSAYTVSLSVNNTFGGEAANIKTRVDYIRTLIGATEISITPVDGITIDQRYGKPFLIYNSSNLNSYTTSANWSLLTSMPPERYGWQNISFVSSDGIGFKKLANQTIMGNVSTVYFHTRNLTATNTTHQIGVNYQLMTANYPAQSAITSEIWEGALPADTATFEYFASLIPPTGYTSVSTIPFTAHITKKPPFGEENATIIMSISSSWYDSLVETPATPVIIIGTGDDPSGNTIGAGLKPTRMREGGIDYFVAKTPYYFTKFGLAQISGSGNPFQLITLTIAHYIGPGSDSGSDTARGTGITAIAAVQNTQAPEITPASLPDTGKTAKLYSNTQGVITQATTLQSTDGLASVSIREGIVAKNSTGVALSSITIKSIPDGSVPDIPHGSAFTYAGMAYDLQPDNCTFSPSISLIFTIPQAHWGQDFMVKTYDVMNSTWLDLPTSYNPDTGIVTSQISQFCIFALFTRAVIPAPTDALTGMPTPVPTTPIAPPAPTAFSTFSGIILWITDIAIKNAVFVAGIVILAVAIFLYGRKRRRDRIMYFL